MNIHSVTKLEFAACKRLKLLHDKSKNVFKVAVVVCYALPVEVGKNESKVNEEN